MNNKATTGKVALLSKSQSFTDRSFNNSANSYHNFKNQKYSNIKIRKEKKPLIQLSKDSSLYSYDCN